MKKQDQASEFAAIEQLLVHYAQLSEEQQAIIAQKRLVGRKTPTEWLALLERLIRYDAERGKVVGVSKPKAWRNHGFNIGCYGFGIMFFGALILFFLVDNFPIPWWSIPAFIGLGLLSILILWNTPQARYYRQMDRKLNKAIEADVPDFLRNLVAPLLVILKEEMKPQALLTLRVDMRSRQYKSGADSVLKRNHRFASGYTLQGSDFSQHEWVMLTGRLHEGTHFQYRLTDEVIKRRLRKSKRKGYKYKDKYKIKQIQHLRLSLPTARYQVKKLPPSPKGPWQMALTEEAERRVLKVKSQKRSKSLDTIDLDKGPTLREVFALLNRAYSFVVEKK
ncbi:MAG: hypothetical protein HC913_07180 [Microscillaceae bacterium]|nr:hypothetical protein [Microscillaceae bacterium]